VLQAHTHTMHMSFMLHFTISYDTERTLTILSTSVTSVLINI